MGDVILSVWLLGAIGSLLVGAASLHKMRPTYGWMPWLPPARLFAWVVIAAATWPAFWPITLVIYRRGR